MPHVCRLPPPAIMKQRPDHWRDINRAGGESTLRTRTTPRIRMAVQSSATGHCSRHDEFPLVVSRRDRRAPLTNVGVHLAPHSYLAGDVDSWLDGERDARY